MNQWLTLVLLLACTLVVPVLLYRGATLIGGFLDRHPIPLLPRGYEDEGMWLARVHHTYGLEQVRVTNAVEHRTYMEDPRLREAAAGLARHRLDRDKGGMERALRAYLAVILVLAVSAVLARVRLAVWLLLTQNVVQTVMLAATHRRRRRNAERALALNSGPPGVPARCWPP